MSTRILAATLFASAFLSAAAHADWVSGTNVGQYGSEKLQPSNPLVSRASSSPYTLNMKWMEKSDSGLLYAYRAKLQGARIPGDGRLAPSPATAQSGDYALTQEGQLIARRQLGNYNLDYVGGLGWDKWRQSASMNPVEDSSVWFLRTGVNLDQPMQSSGFYGGGGLKLPLKASEDAYPNSLVSSITPPLEAGRSVNLYAELAYRTSSEWDIVGYYDSWRFRQSDSAYSSSGQPLYSIVQPQSSTSTFGLKAMYSF